MLETMLNTKVIVPTGVSEAIAEDVEGFLHISVMCCHSVMGEVIPPFMILPTMQSLPNELKIYTEFGQNDIFCAPAGYMKRDAFLLRSITFINHLNVHILKLPSSIQNSKAVLIHDRHSAYI